MARGLPSCGIIINSKVSNPPLLNHFKGYFVDLLVVLVAHVEIVQRTIRCVLQICAS